MHLLRSAAVATSNLGDNRAGDNAVSDNLRLHLIRPTPTPGSRIDLNMPRGHPSAVVRMVVHCEHCPIKGTGLPYQHLTRLSDQKGGGAPLTHQRFLSLEQANAAVALLLGVLNAKITRTFKRSRANLFREIDQPELKPLPAQPYVYAEWRKARLGPDYHIEVDGHWYSAPFQLIKEPVEARITARTVEIFHKGTRVAAHPRSRTLYRHTTTREHMPSSHRRHFDWTPKRLRAEAAGIGPATAALVEHILEDRPHPEQGFRACLGILALKRSFGGERLEAACCRGIDLDARTCGAIADILKSGLDKAFLKPAPDPDPVQHANIRGPDYYQ